MAYSDQHLKLLPWGHPGWEIPEENRPFVGPTAGWDCRENRQSRDRPGDLTGRGPRWHLERWEVLLRQENRCPPASQRLGTRVIAPRNFPVHRRGNLDLGCRRESPDLEYSQEHRETPEHLEFLVSPSRPGTLECQEFPEACLDRLKILADRADRLMAGLQVAE